LFQRASDAHKEKEKRFTVGVPFFSIVFRGGGGLKIFGRQYPQIFADTHFCRKLNYVVFRRRGVPALQTQSEGVVKNFGIYVKIFSPAALSFRDFLKKSCTAKIFSLHLRKSCFSDGKMAPLDNQFSISRMQKNMNLVLPKAATF